uniref:Novel STAND NTPase 1 domain-containing protein n=1 Tax=uncultured Chloroflexota bacterium TaxID=166587 RepID=H5SBE8_9CHLR|nr:hypothetical protein HGMM_F07C06C06 [uncultured Chloroflexota bacterium]
MFLSFDSAIVRIRARDGKPLGAGFLAAPDLILTCWHVAQAALHDERLRLDFPTVAPGELLTARLESRDEARDLAALRLETPAPAGCHPVRLVTADDLWEHPCRAFGFPKGYDRGVWAEGKLLDVIGDEGWVQVSSQGDYPIQPGFSGAPLWDTELNGAVGMVVAADSPSRAAFCIPAARLLAFRPDLQAHALPPNPYRGLLAFREQDAALFFGREAVSAEVWEWAQKKPLVALVGPSGSGKSSVALAGVLPRARQNPDWAVTSLRPGREPFRELAAALLPLLEPSLSETDRLLEIPKLSVALERGEIPLTDVLRRILQRTEKTRLLVLLDQAEELYTLCEEAPRRAFLDLWLRALAEPRAPVRLLLTLRADFLSQALLDRALADALQNGTYLLGPMRREDLQAAIVEPARRHDVTFEDGLVERILDEVGEAAGQLPLLEFALTQLWERQERGRLTHAAYEAIGGVEGALTRHAEAVYEGEFDESEREDLRRVFVQLVTPGEGTEDTRRRAARAELGEARWALTRRLADARLVVTGQDAEGRDYAEVSHEALISRWARLVCGAFSTLQPALVERVLRAALQDGTALVLLDALDEAPLSAAERAGFLDGLHRWWQGESHGARPWKGNHLLLTSRPRALPASKFSTFAIQPMRPADLSDLAYHLGKALLRQLAEEGLSLSQSESDSLLEELLRLVERLSRADLSSPFYATLLTVGVLRARSAAGGLKQAESIRQPARLYRFFIAQTLEWERGKPNAPASLPDLETALRALAQLAWGTLGDAELRQSLSLPPLPAADLAAALTFWERSGLIWRDPLSLEWEFVHRGFEQFGRALYLHAAWQQPALAAQVEALQRATLGQEEWDEVWEMVYGL